MVEWNDMQNDKETKIHAQCKANDEVSRNATPLLYVSHPEVIYHGRLLEFNNLSKPNKANRRSKLPSSLPYSVFLLFEVDNN
ncbi:unnamed protein product [Rhizophagus irregularis]|nr:unnamed protein product [Rhizophagus irregularis]